MATFGQKIQAIRFFLGLTQEEIASRLGVTKQVISKYENEQTSPRLDTVDRFAKALGIELTFLINDEFSVDETLDALGKNLVIVTEANAPSEIKRRINSSLSRLNPVGQTKVADYADDLDKSGQYQREDSEAVELGDATYSYVHTDARAAAGGGAHNDESSGSYRQISLEEAPEHYDAIIDVTGDSMTPTIPDGSVAFIEFAIGESPKDGEIYVIQAGEDTLIKRCYFEPDRIILKSDNPQYKDRTICEFDRDSFRIIGPVISWQSPSA